MTTFLKSIAKQYYSNEREQLRDFTFIFPNKRAAVFFNKYISELSDTPIWAPKIMSIRELIEKISSLQLVDNILLQFELYQSYKEVSLSEESFDEFYSWGEIIASDFNDIDKYRVDAEQLFQNIYDLKEIDSLNEYLSEEQIATIRTFWRNFNPVNTENKERFLTMWKILFPLYTRLRERLVAENKGYEGMLYREITDRILLGKENLLEGSNIKQLVFCGFNALTKTELLLFKYFNKSQCADFYWDYCSELMDVPNNRAYPFIKQHLSLFPSKYPISETHQLTRKKIELINTSSATGMAQEAGLILEQLSSKGDETMDDTALVLADENLLMPCLYALPHEITKINITMGYPLRNSAVYQLIHLLIDLHEKTRKQKSGEVFFYYKQVLSILDHKIINQTLLDKDKGIGQKIIAEKLIQVPSSFFSNNPLLSLIFSLTETGNDFATLLARIIQTIQTGSTEMTNIDAEFNYHFFIHNQRLKELFKNYFTPVSVKTYGSLLRKLMDQISIPFEGEPLCGLQILGVLETRNIDFKKIIITSMNEGKFPKYNQQSSFIPYNLRKGFELPTPELQDSIFSYYFHRLISRAEQIWILYDSRTEGINTGEVSRYCHLIKYEYAPNFPEQIILSERNVSRQPQLQNPRSFSIPKSELVLAELEKYKEGNIRHLSPSAINTYTNCSAQFYFRYLRNIYPPNEIKEEIDHALLGSVFHDTMEEIYKPYEKQEITAQLVDLLLKNKTGIKQLVEEHFIKNTSTQNKTKYSIRGQDHITLNLIQKYIERTLRYDHKYTPFIYLEGEKEFSHLLVLNQELKINIKGKIDRVDLKNNTIRVIDYKSGTDKLLVSSIEELFNSNSPKREKGIFQTFLYTLMLQKEPKYNTYQLEPHIYSLRKLFDENFNSMIKIKGNLIEDFNEIGEEFEQNLVTHLKTLFDPAVPFYQTENEDNCTYCNFKKICNRNGSNK